jgi:DNA-binding transcriptional LysR family regulator
VKLYVKSGRGVKLTLKGRALRVAAKPILDQMEELRGRFVSKGGKGVTKDLVVGSTPSPAAYFLSAALRSFVELYPTIHPTIRTGYPDAIKEMVLSGEVEIALTTTFPDHPQVIAEPIYTEEIVAVVSTKHPLARKKTLKEVELMQVPFVMMTGGRIAEEIAKMGLKLNVVIRCESVDLEKETVQAGLGVGLFYRGSAEAGLREGYFKIIEIRRLKEIKINCFVIYRKEKGLSSNGRDLLTLLQQWRKPGRSEPNIVRFRRP